jgi:hypothetical protein
MPPVYNTENINVVLSRKQVLSKSKGEIVCDA